MSFDEGAMAVAPRQVQRKDGGATPAAASDDQATTQNVPEWMRAPSDESMTCDASGAPICEVPADDQVPADDKAAAAPSATQNGASPKLRLGEGLYDHKQVKESSGVGLAKMQADLAKLNEPGGLKCLKDPPKKSALLPPGPTASQGDARDGDRARELEAARGQRLRDLEWARKSNVGAGVYGIRTAIYGESHEEAMVKAKMAEASFKLGALASGAGAKKTNADAALKVDDAQATPRPRAGSAVAKP